MCAVVKGLVRMQRHSAAFGVCMERRAWQAHLRAVVVPVLDSENLAAVAEVLKPAEFQRRDDSSLVVLMRAAFEVDDCVGLVVAHCSGGRAKGGR